MPIDSISALRSAVEEWANDAIYAVEEAGLLTFSEQFENKSLPRQRAKAAQLSLVLQPEYEDKGLYFCEKCWGMILSVDLRGSTLRAMDVGPRNTLVTMHVYMRTMIRLVNAAGGTVVGLRGDGLLAAFGRKEVGDDKPRVTTEESDEAIGNAATCGDAMVRAVKKVINPTLAKRNVPADLEIGVDLECGHMVVTKIGLPNAYDVTAYGTCVNMAAKISSENKNRNKVLIGRNANEVWSRENGGWALISRFGTDMFQVEYPPDYPTLV